MSPALPPGQLVTGAAGELGARGRQRERDTEETETVDIGAERKNTGREYYRTRMHLHS